MRVSVLVPCFNAGAYLGEALQSALSQDPRPAEVIVVDDGSTDDSRTIAGSFGSRVRCHAAPHLGISATRNRCLELATGDAIAFLDADDVWTEGSLACRMALLMGDTRVGIACGYVEQFVSPELSDEVRRRLHCAPERHAGGVLGSMLIRRAIFADVGSFDSSLRIGETIDWIARARSLGVRSATSDATVLRRRIHATNTGVTSRELRVDYLRVLKASLDRQRESRGEAAR